MKSVKNIKKTKKISTFCLISLLFYFSYSFCFLVINQSFAKDLGVWGDVYEIAEDDFLVFIHNRFDKMRQSGEYAELKRDFVRHVKDHTLRPRPVFGITTTRHPRTFFYDPTYIAPSDIRDEEGNIIVSKGARFNPLDKIRLHKVLFFLDADDKREIKWALDHSRKYDFVKYILVKGNIKDASRVLNNRVYFDQNGLITRKLGIRHVPSIVMQKELHRQEKQKYQTKQKKRERSNKKQVLEIREFSLDDYGESS